MLGFTPMLTTAGTWAIADNYEQVQSASVPINGSPLLIMLRNEPVFYIISMQAGQKYINAYSFQTMNSVQMPQQEEPVIQTAQPTTEERLSSLELSIQNIEKMLKGAVNNEPDHVTTAKDTTSKSTKSK